MPDLTEPLKPRFECDAFADRWNVDRTRAMVWNAFSFLFTDSDWSNEELSWIGENIANSNFSIHELSHIIAEEVAPVCGSNRLLLVGGEGPLGFDEDWLVEKCSYRQKSNSYQASTKPDEIPWFVHLKCPFFFEGYLMLYRVKRLRASRIQAP